MVSKLKVYFQILVKLAELLYCWLINLFAAFWQKSLFFRLFIHCLRKIQNYNHKAYEFICKKTDGGFNE